MIDIHQAAYELARDFCGYGELRREVLNQRIIELATLHAKDKLMEKRNEPAKWEYKRVVMAQEADFELAANDLGQDGWELLMMRMDPPKPNVVLYFRRRSVAKEIPLRCRSVAEDVSPLTKEKVQRQCHYPGEHEGPHSQMREDATFLKWEMAKRADGAWFTDTWVGDRSSTPPKSPPKQETWFEPGPNTTPKPLVPTTSEDLSANAMLFQSGYLQMHARSLEGVERCIVEGAAASLKLAADRLLAEKAL